MSWIFFALLAPAIWAAVNHIDKYIISRYFHDSSPLLLVLFTSLTAGLAAIILGMIFPIGSISILQAVAIIVGGMIFVAAYIPYVYALKEDEASLVAPLFQMIFVFSFLLGYIFLNERLTIAQFLASLCIMAGSICLSLDLDSSVRKLRSKTFYRMMLASFLIALNMLVFKIIALESSFWVTTFWEYVGAFLFGILILIFFKKTRYSFFDVFKKTKIIIRWNIFNETLNLAARLSANFASLFAPLALVSIANGMQPFFIVLYGAIIPFLFKGIDKEKFYGKYLWQKVLSIALMVFGAYFLFR